MQLYASNTVFLLLLLFGFNSPIKAFQIGANQGFNPNFESFVAKHQVDSIFHYISNQSYANNSAADSVFIQQEALPFLVQNRVKSYGINPSWIQELKINIAWKKSYLIQIYIKEGKEDVAYDLCTELEQDKVDTLALMRSYCLIINNLITRNQGLKAGQYFMKAKALFDNKSALFWWTTKANYTNFIGLFRQAISAYDTCYRIANNNEQIAYDYLFFLRLEQAKIYATISAYSKASSTALEAIQLFPKTYGILFQKSIECRLLLAKSYLQQPGKELETLLCLRQILAQLSYVKSSRSKVLELETHLLFTKQFLAINLLDSAQVYLQKIKDNKGHYRQQDYYKYLAQYQQQKGAINLSVMSFQKRLDISQAQYGASHPNTLNAQLDIAVELMRNKAYSKAITLLDQAFDANICAGTADTIRSLDLALRINQKRVASMMQWYAQSQYNVSLQKMEQLAEYSILLLQQNYRASLSIQSNKIHRSIIEQAIEIHVLIYKRSNDIAHIQYAFSLSEWARKIQLLASMSPAETFEFGNIPQSLIADLEQIRFRKKWLNNQRQLQLIQQDSSHTFWLGQLHEQIATQQMSIKAKLLRDFPQFLQWFSLDSLVSVATIQAKLPTNSILLHYFEGEDALYQFIIKEDSFVYRKIVWQNYKSTLAKYYKHFTNTQLIQHKHAGGFKDFCLSSYQIYYKIMHHQLLQSVDRLIIVPDGLMQYIPFETLLTAIPLDSVHRLDFKNLEYIFKSKSISYQYTANQCTASKRIFQSAQKVRILGMTANYEADNIPGFRSSTIKKRRALLPLLNDAHEQTDILAQQFEGDFYIEKYATEYYFKKYAPQYDVLHLSLYPGLNQQSMDKNYLAFSEDGHQQEDNFLVTTEIQALPLQVGLTVLNYSKIDCRQMSNANGLMAISAAFMYAGSQAVLYNLWSNKSDFLPAILSSYYQNLQANLPKDRALQKAKLDYLKASNDTTAHPAYWASLLQFGALDPLEISEPVIHIWWFVLPIAFIGLLGWWCLQGLKQRKK